MQHRLLVLVSVACLECAQICAVVASEMPVKAKTYVPPAAPIPYDWSGLCGRQLRRCIFQRCDGRRRHGVDPWQQIHWRLHAGYNWQFGNFCWC